MKLLVITSSAPYGMGESFVVKEVNSYVNIGVKVWLAPVIIRRGEQNKIELNPSVNLIDYEIWSPRLLVKLMIFFLLNPLTIINILRILRCRKIFNFIKNILIIPKALWLAEVVKKENITHVHAHWVSTPSSLAMIISYLTGVPWSCTAHRGDIVSNNLLCKKISNAVFVRCISESGVNLIKKYCKTINSHIRVLHMGVDFPLEIGLKQSATNFTVLCPANLIEVKGHRYLLQAWSSLRIKRPATLILAGDGVLKNNLLDLSLSLGISESVKFVGQIQHSELLSMYKMHKVDLVILPSLDLGNGLHEGIPVSLMEAMAYGIPVIATNTGGIPELLGDGSGVMVQQADAKALCDAIEIFANDNKNFYKYGLAGRAKVKEKFNQSIVTKCLVNWFNE